MFSFCCYPAAGKQRRSFRNKIHFSTKPTLSSLKIDNFLIEGSSEKSLESVLSHVSIEKKLHQQNWCPEIVENGNPPKLCKASVKMKSSTMNSDSESSFKLTSLAISRRTVRLRNARMDISNNSLFTGCTAHTITYAPVPMTKILPHLYIGSYENAMDEFELRSKGITHTLSLVGRNWHLDFVEQEAISMHDLGRTNLKEVLQKVSKFMEQGQQDKNKILVHCQSGQNRSATVIIAYLLTYHKETLYRAHKRLKRLRPLVQINQGYAKQLLALEKEIFGKNSLPSDWMERGAVNMETGEIKYKHENMNSAQHLAIFDSNE